MRILVLNYEFPPVGGGGGRFTQDLCRHLARRGHEVRVQTAHFRGLPRREYQNGYLVCRAFAARGRVHTCSVAEMAGYVAGNFLPALRQAAAWRPQVIQAHFAVPTGALAWMVKKFTGIPYILSTQLGDVPGGVPDQTDHLFRWLKPFTLPIWREAAAVTAPSRTVADLAYQAYGLPVRVIPNGVDLEALPPASPEVHTPVRLVFVGRFSPQKNLEFLINVLIMLKNLDWQLELVGDGPLRPYLEELTRRHGLGPRVRFTGWLTPDAALARLRESDVLLLPSRSEGLPLVGLQALGLGLAIAASDYPSLRELVAEGVNGFTRPGSEPGPFAAALCTVLRNSDLISEMKQASRLLARRFDAARVAARFEALLAAVAKAGEARGRRT
jgi:glycosyltransferase involved in cell wall biosynthesis